MACALAAVEALTGGDDPLDSELVRQAFLQCAPVELEVVRRGPTVLVDAAHNPAGMRATLDAVQESLTSPSSSAWRPCPRTRTLKACSTCWNC